MYTNIQYMQYVVIENGIHGIHTATLGLFYTIVIQLYPIALWREV